MNLEQPPQPPQAGYRNKKTGVIIRDLKTFRSFKNPVFRLYYGALMAQMAAVNMQMIARSLLVYRLTGSPAILGGIALTHALPVLFLSLFGGVISDRLRKKNVLIVGQLGSAVVALCIALALTFGYLSLQYPSSWWMLMAASVFQGIIMGLIIPSRQAFIAEIVGAEQLMNAVALNALGMNILRLTAPALAGILIDLLDFKAVYFTMTGLYLVGVLFVSFMPNAGKTDKMNHGVFEDLQSTLHYVIRNTTISLILLFALFAVLLSMPYMSMMPVFVDDILRVGATGMGLMISISGVGAMTGSLLLASLPNRKRGVMLLLSCLLLGLALTVFSFSTNWPLSLVVIAFVGLGQSGRMTLTNTLLQYYVSNDYRGRVMSLYTMEFGLTSFGVFFVGILAETIGVQWSVGGFALLLIMISALNLICMPRIRNLE